MKHEIECIEVTSKSEFDKLVIKYAKDGYDTINIDYGKFYRSEAMVKDFHRILIIWKQ